MANKQITFSAVGDISFGDHPMCAGFGAYSRFKKEDPSFPFEKVSHIFKQSDLTFANLECSHSDIGLKKNDLSSIQMRGDPRNIQGLVDAGIDVVNVANNHSMQHGKEVFLDSIQNLETHNIQHCGANPDDHLIGIPTIVKKNGLSVAFFGYSLRPRQYFEYAPLYTEGHEDGIIRDIKKIRDEVDIVVISVHWGDEFIQRPSPEEIRTARNVIDAGANLIIGHHPHVLRGIEEYHGGYIVYSLGNFVCDMVWDDTLRSSMIFQCQLTQDGVKDINLIPTYTNNNFQPEILERKQAELALSKMDSLSKSLATETMAEYDKLSEKYILDADDALQDNRRKCHRFFLFRIWKFPIVVVLQQLATFFRNRVHELVHR